MYLTAYAPLIRIYKTSILASKPSVNMLKRLILSTLLFVPLSVIQAQWSDNFSDNNFVQNPAWIGDISKFTIDTSGQLQLYAPELADTAWLCTSSVICYKASWQFRVRMSFNPSSTNYAKVFLTSTESDLKGSLDGYFVRIGHTNDDLCLFRKQGTTETLIADGRDKMFNTSVVNSTIKVTRDERSRWTLYCDTTGGNLLSEVAQGTDSSITSSAWLGVFCKYTATRCSSFYFDDFKVEGDTFPSVSVPDTIIDPDSPDTLKNPMVDAPDNSKFYDVVFNEIMVDPFPVAGLPEVEYIELYNRSDSVVHLKGWELLIGSTSCKFPEINMHPGDYLIICARADTALLQPFGQTLGLWSSSVSLNNSGQLLKLMNSKGAMIHWLNYSDTWYDDDFKKGGGYSIEQIDPDNPCGGQSNWRVSNARKGGTPGVVNSVKAFNPDSQIPIVKSVNITSDTLIAIRFNEPVDTSVALQSRLYNISQGIGIPKKVWISNQLYSEVSLLLQSPLMPASTYTLTISDSVCDCVGQKMENAFACSIGLPSIPKASELVLNEIRFNAPAGSAEYIELYNPSGKFFNAREVLIGKRTEGKPDNLCRLSDDGFLIPPASYLLLSQQPEVIAREFAIYQTANFYQVPSLLTLDDSESDLILLNDTFGTVDELVYSEKMHSSMLNSFDGVALERINPFKPSSLAENWHSASEKSGYGTPGYKNSQYLSDSISGVGFVVEYELFSPDNDGYHDNLQVTYSFDQVGVRGEASVYDVSGKLVRRLFTNRLLGTSGNFLWDGNDDNGKRSQVGPYLIFIRTVTDKGTVREYRKGCILAIKK
jgi:hypothetical protein